MSTTQPGDGLEHAINAVDTSLLPDADGALESGGEVPLFTRRTFGVLAIPALTWLQLSAVYSLGLPIFQAYLGAPANMVAAASISVSYTHLTLPTILLV